MPAFPAEILEAEEEGIEISFLVSPVRVIGENGKISQLECVKNRLGPPDEDGRRRPVEIKGFQLLPGSRPGHLGHRRRCGPIRAAQETGHERRHVILRMSGGRRNRRGSLPGATSSSSRAPWSTPSAPGKRAAIFIDCLLKGQKWEGLFEALRVGEKGSLSMKRYLQEESERVPLELARRSA